MMTTTPDPSPVFGNPANARGVYCPVARLLNARQFGVFVLLTLGLTIFELPQVTREMRVRGFDYRWIEVATPPILDKLVWIGLAIVIWRLLDALPLAPGVRARNLAARVALACGTALVEAALFPQLVRLATWLYRDQALVPPIPILESTALLLKGVNSFLWLAVWHLMWQRSFEHRRQSALERSLAHARLHALSLQLQPHFLFNTLNGIAALVREDPRRAEEMVIRLSDLLRLTLRSGSTGQVPLRDELDQLGLYVGIQSMRFGPRLRVLCDVDPATLQAQVPGMLLQPLVENALTHGIGPRPGPGMVRVIARQHGPSLVLTIKDDGVGMSAGAPRQERTGLGTTRARLAAMFGTEQALVLASPAGGGVEAVVRIPFTIHPTS